MVADTKSFRRAAELCFRSESAVSMQIRQLEEQLGFALFERTTRNVKLTEEGHSLAFAVRTGLDHIAAAIKDSQKQANRHTREVTIVAAPSIAAALVPGILTKFRLDFPDVLVTLRQASSVELTEMVRTGDADLGLGSSIPVTKDLVFEPLLMDELIPVFPAAQAVKYLGGISMEEFSKCPLILNEKAVNIRQQLDSALAEHGITISARYQTLEFGTTLALVSSGLGVGVVPRLALLGATSSVRPVPIIGMKLRRPIGIFLSPGKPLTPATSALLQIARQELTAYSKAAESSEREISFSPTPKAHARNKRRSRAHKVEIS